MTQLKKNEQMSKNPRDGYDIKMYFRNVTYLLHITVQDSLIQTSQHEVTSDPGQLVPLPHFHSEFPQVQVHGAVRRPILQEILKLLL